MNSFRSLTAPLGLCSLLLFSGVLAAQSPNQIVQQAVDTEMAASHNDHSLWRYRQEEKIPVHTISIVVETNHGSIKQKIEQNGQPITAEQTAAEMRRIQSFINNPKQQQKQRRDNEHDDQSASKLLEMLPKAFLWKVASETTELTTLSFSPNPDFNPPDMEARVMGVMVGELIVDKTQHRIRSIRGKLSENVYIGFGLLGKLWQGGTFDVERREISPGLWQIVETHVHIDGRALLFKTIGQQQDEINSDYTRVPDATTLEQAVGLLAAPKGTDSTQ